LSTEHAADHADGVAHNAPSPAEGCVVSDAVAAGKPFGALAAVMLVFFVPLVS
jgi:hypothetical protein